MPSGSSSSSCCGRSTVMYVSLVGNIVAIFLFAFRSDLGNGNGALMSVQQPQLAGNESSSVSSVPLPTIDLLSKGATPHSKGRMDASSSGGLRSDTKQIEAAPGSTKNRRNNRKGRSSSSSDAPNDDSEREGRGADDGDMKELGDSRRGETGMNNKKKVFVFGGKVIWDDWTPLNTTFDPDLAGFSMVRETEVIIPSMREEGLLKDYNKTISGLNLRKKFIEEHERIFQIRLRLSDTVPPWNETVVEARTLQLTEHSRKFLDAIVFPTIGTTNPATTDEYVGGANGARHLKKSDGGGDGEDTPAASASTSRDEEEGTREKTPIINVKTIAARANFTSTTEVVMGLWGGKVKSRREIVTYCQSLRETGTNASIVFFVEKMDAPFLLQYVGEYHVTVIVYDKKHFIGKPMDRRSKLYRAFLEHFPTFQRIWVMDTKDIYYQTDPILMLEKLYHTHNKTIFFSGELTVSLHKTLAYDNDLNTLWAQNCFGRSSKFTSQITGRTVLCTGSIGFFNRDSALMTLRIIDDVMEAAARLRCMDQGVVHYVARANPYIHQNSYIIKPEYGGILVWYGVNEFHVDEDTAMLTSPTGVPYSVIHQYNRCSSPGYNGIQGTPTLKLISQTDRKVYPIKNSFFCSYLDGGSPKVPLYVLQLVKRKVSWKP